MILIVDDMPGVVVAFGRVLQRLDVAYWSTGSVAGAMAALDRNHWNGFLLDLFLPDGTGVEVLEAMRTHTRYRNTPAAVITADILVESELVARIVAARASLTCGVFDRSAIESICSSLLLRH